MDIMLLFTEKSDRGHFMFYIKSLNSLFASSRMFFFPQGHLVEVPYEHSIKQIYTAGKKLGGDILLLVRILLVSALASASGSGDTLLFARYLMNRWVDFKLICMDFTLGHVEELIRF